MRLANRRHPARIEHPQAEKLARLCGHLPLAIELTANAVSVSAGASVAEYLRRLEQRTKPLAALDRVKASLQLSLETLDAETKERWSALGVIPSFFDRADAKALWRAEEADPTLSVLEQQSLITYEVNTDTYHIHDVLQAIALDELSNKTREKERFLRRYKDHLTTLFDSTASLEALSAGSLSLAQTIFEEELKNHLSTRLKESLGSYIRIFLGLRSLQHRLAYRFWSLGLVYRERGMSTTALSQFERAVEISKKIRDRKGVARYSINLAEALIWDEDPDPRRALEIIELGMAQRLKGFEHLHAWTMVKLGDYYFWRCGQIEEAEAAYNRALTMRVSPLAKAYCLRTLGRIHMNGGSREKAVEYLEQSLAIYRGIDVGGDVKLTRDLLVQAAANSERGARP